MELRELVATHLDAARNRTLGLLAPFDDGDLCRQVSPLMSPLVWDLAHIGHYEELWLVRELGRRSAIDRRYDDLYDAFAHPRRERAELAILGPRDARAYVREVRERALDVLADSDLASIDPLLARGFVLGMVIQHEHQHDETLLATIQLMERPYTPAAAVRRLDATAGGTDAGELALPGGPFVMGTDEEPWAYDNERPAHEVVLAPFRIDAAPTTNAQFAAFMSDGGYDDPRHWTEEGWKWRQDAATDQPLFWLREGSGTRGIGDWSRIRFGVREAVPPHEPVQHVCWYEADAYARWAVKRLPTEAEWEYAAAWGPDARKRRYPWGNVDPTTSHANLGQVQWGPTPVGAHPVGASAWGCEQMVGDVWEWTSSDFSAYPGFRPFPYPEYSDVFFGGSEYKVLRGGSWAVHPVACRATFRNWDYPIRRQIFSGFRCARDA